MGLLMALAFCLGHLRAAEAAPDFESTIRPLLQKHCIECHGAAKQKGELRLDARVFALRGGHDGPAITPGNSSQSLLYQRLISTDDKERMPAGKPPLPPAELALLRQWLDAGATWPESAADRAAAVDKRLSHWAYQPIQPITPPRSAHHLPAHPIDTFIRQGLRSQNLAMALEADRRTLIRRLSYDLLGLPPTPEEVAAFLADERPRAYEHLVDSYLRSPHYGERQARHWLDIAHHADTHGFERDQRRNHAWRYRDYVIASFNADKPYERFLQEQIAGDVMWPDSEEAMIATGFLAAGPWDFVGQVEAKGEQLKRAARALDLDDMVTQVMTATQATTVNCARCHDHKLDPISQREYYGLWAVFAGLQRAEQPINPKAAQQHAEQKKRLEQEQRTLQHQIAVMEGSGWDLADLVGGGNGLGTGKPGHGIDPRNGKGLTEKQSFLSGIQTNQWVKAVSNPYVDGVVIPDGKDGQSPVPISSTGIQVSGLPKTSGLAWDAIRLGPVNRQHSTVLGGIDYAKDKHSLLGIHANAGITLKLEAFRNKDTKTPPRFRLQGGVGYFGKEGHVADAWIFLDGVKMLELRQLKRERGVVPLEIAIPDSARFLTLMSTDGGDGIGFDQVAFTDLRLIADTTTERSAEQQAQLAQLKAQLKTTQESLTALPPPALYYGIKPGPPPAVHLLKRGDPETPGDVVPPLALAALVMLKPALGGSNMKEGERRRALAEWITDPRNPLTRRVTVNRLWHWHFGQGLVNTPSDFGLGGDRPSHPELLDWLAEELLREKGSLKAIHRLIVTSAAYRQQSFASEAMTVQGAAVDGNNRLLWRQNPRRLDAESVRDGVLRITGCLNPAMGGPGYEDFRYTEAYAPVYEYRTADEPALWRRSVYRYVVRSTPQAFLTTLDCPDPANLTPTRLTTTTALQSLALFNNDFMLRQARHWTNRLTQECPPEDRTAQVQRAFELAYSRPATAEEVTVALSFIQQQGLFAFCRSLLNSNECVYVD